MDQIGDMARQLNVERMVAEDVADERPAPEDPPPGEPMNETRVNPMRRRVRAQKVVAPRIPIYVWSFESSRARAGTPTVYATELFEDGTVRCNCPGWVYKRKDALGCKHTDQVRHEIPTLLQMFKDGAAFPVLPKDKVEIKTGFTSAPTKPAQPQDDSGGIRYGRKIEV